MVVSALLLVVLCSIEFGLSSGPVCKDQDGNDVAWFVIYKLPKIRSQNAFVNNGSGWVYFGPTSEDWTMAPIPISSVSSAAGFTILPLFGNNNSTLAYVLYNDQPPNQPQVATGGHTKGILITNSTKGIWILHSIPHFPFSITQKDSFYPKTGLINGQLFFCMSLQPAQVDSVGKIFEYTRPNIFDFSIPETMESVLPTLTSVAKKGGRVKIPPWYKMFQLTLGNNLQFEIFAKGPKSNQEIYSDWIAPKLQTPIDVQSWLNGPNPLPSNCTSNFTTHNIILKDAGGEEWSTHLDHSKWAVGTLITNKWTCLADLNRMEHQLARGGASICTQDGVFWKLFSKLLKTVQPCPRQVGHP